MREAELLTRLEMPNSRHSVSKHMHMNVSSDVAEEESRLHSNISWPQMGHRGRVFSCWVMPGR